MSATTTTSGAVRRAWAAVRWYLKEATGEARWDEHVARCREDGRDPGSRRDFERHRAEHRERAAGSGRCC